MKTPEASAAKVLPSGVKIGIGSGTKRPRRRPARTTVVVARADDVLISGGGVRRAGRYAGTYAVPLFVNRT